MLYELKYFELFQPQIINARNLVETPLTNEFKEEVVICPNCRRKRLFDASADSKGIIKIKCDLCRRVVDINLDRIHTVQIGA
jgi:hypothetical protein